jgi:hypothetical protein
MVAKWKKQNPEDNDYYVVRMGRKVGLHGLGPYHVDTYATPRIFSNLSEAKAYARSMAITSAYGVFQGDVYNKFKRRIAVIAAEENPAHMNKYKVTVEVEAPSKAAARAQVERVENPIRYSVVEEDGYVKVRHPEYGTVAAATIGPDGKLRNIEFTEERYRKINAIRMPAMDALIKWQKKSNPGNGRNPITPYKSASERMMERPDIPPVPYFKLYSAPLRSRLAIRAPMLEASSEDISELKQTGVWKYQPSVITDEMGNIVFDNGVG